MLNWYNHLQQLLARSDQRPTRLARNVRPGAEQLERREVMTVTYLGGPLIPNVQVEAIFYGQAWQSGPSLQAQKGAFEDYLRFITNSSFMDMLTQAGYNVGRGRFLDAVTDPVSPPTTVEDSQIQNDLASLITSGTVGAPDQNRLYFVFVQPGVVIDVGGGITTAQGLYGYHDAFAGPGGSTVHYAVVPYPGGPNSSPTAGVTTFQMITGAASHELAESVTDPEPSGNPGWVDGVYNEIGDVDGANLVWVSLDGYVAQKIADQNDQPMIPIGATPLLTAVGQDVSAAAGQPFSGVVATVFDDWPNAAPGSLNATITWADGQTSAGWVTNDANGNGGFGVSGTNTYAQGGAYAVSVTVQDTANNLTVVASATASVTAPAGSLTATGQTISATAGQPFSGVVATITDTFSGVTANNLQATITWGAGQTSPGTLVDEGGGTFDVNGTYIYAHAGTYAVSVTVHDAVNDQSATAQGTAHVQAPAGSLKVTGHTISATAGRPFSGVVATITDTFSGVTANNLQATITWGNGQTSPGTLVDEGGGTFSVSGKNTYALAGSYTVSVTTRDTANGQSAIAHDKATVQPVAVPPSRGITAQLVDMKLGRKKSRLMIEVFFADTGAKKSEFASPFQPPGFKNIQVSVRDSNGDGVPDLVIVTARKGKRVVTASFPG
jgi:hypothetical protein